jgi:uncharacterized protein (DUF305 family)
MGAAPIQLVDRRCVVRAGCAAPGSKRSSASDETDVWFMQHMVPHLLQTTAIIDLAREHITRPELARLADTINQQDKPTSPSSKHGWQAEGWPLRPPNSSPAATRKPTLPACPELVGPSSTWPS